MSGHRKNPPSSPACRRRPAPPPPPPKALVGLLKKNKGVLNYFTSLQANLEADVQKWKDRARNYQALHEEQLEENEALLKNQSGKAHNGTGKETSPHMARKRRKTTREGEEDNDIGKQQQKSNREARREKRRPPECDNHRSGEEEDGPPATINLRKQTQQTNAQQQQQRGNKKSRDDYYSRLERQPSTDEEELGLDGKHERSEGMEATQADASQVINDEMFDLEFESDGDEDSKDQNEGILATTKKKPLKRNNKKLQSSDKEPAYDVDFDSSDKEEGPPPFWQQHQQFILSELMDAYHCLQHLGIELVERKEAPQEKNAQQGEESVNNNPEQGTADDFRKEDGEEGKEKPLQ